MCLCVAPVDRMVGEVHERVVEVVGLRLLVGLGAEPRKPCRASHGCTFSNLLTSLESYFLNLHGSRAHISPKCTERAKIHTQG